MEIHLGCLFLSTAHINEMVEAPAFRGRTKKTKPATVSDNSKYKTGINKSDQFQRKSVKWWTEVLFHLFDVCTVNAHILHNTLLLLLSLPVLAGAIMILLTRKEHPTRAIL
jgi:hypothetical protein